ncbi:magnesium ion transporter [Tulasnella sp. 419]|nr:magnesium ion transporter [Tulasnella sp. 419]
MYLTEKKAGTPRNISNHEEAEVLLESFSKQVEEIVNETETTISNVQWTQEIVELILDSNRNALLALDLKVSIATMGIGFGALVAGFFGMNLKSHMEESMYAFGAVCLLALLGSGGAMLIGFRILSKIRKVGLSATGSKTKRLRSPLDRQLARLYNVDRSGWS